MPVKKVKIHELIEGLEKAIRNIEESDLKQAEKTRKFKAEAKKFKSTLFTDKRKFRGKGAANRITLNTFNAYLTRARKPFDAMMHHGFTDEINRLSRRYPAWATQLQEWLKLPAPEVRKQHGEMQTALRQIIPLTERLNSIKLGTAGAEKKLANLGNQYPFWRGWLMEMAVRDYKEPQKLFREALRQGVDLLEDLQRLKINHEVTYSLRLEPGERSSLQQKWGENLADKKRSTVTINYPTYMQRVLDILTAPDSVYNQDPARSAIAPLAFALSAVSGRRLIETARLGVFEKVDKQRVKFWGQAKKRTDADEGRIIYTLCDSDLFLQKLAVLRNAPATADFDEAISSMASNDTRTQNQVISDRLGFPFNKFVKDFFGDDRRVFKDSRSLYARICYETWFNKDPRWANCDEDVFFAELLGHDDEDTQTHYKQFKLRNFSMTWTPEKGQENSRLAALEQLDDEMPGFANGDAGVRLHEWVKDQIRENPNAKITTYSLRKNYGANPQLAARYLAFAADALGQAVAENGRYESTETPEPIVIEMADNAEDELDEEADENVDDDELELEETEELPTAENIQQDKPRMTPVQLNELFWKVHVTYQGKNRTWTGQAKNGGDAMYQAWEEINSPLHEEKEVEMPRPRLQLVDGWWTSSIEADGKTLVYIEMEGTRDEVLNATREAWDKL